MSIDQLTYDIAEAIDDHENGWQCIYLAGKAIAMLLLEHRENFSAVLVHGIRAGCLDLATCDESQLETKTKALCALLLAYQCRDVVKITSSSASPSDN